MPRSLKPPRGLFVATEVLFDLQMAPTLRDTLIQLMALAWGTRGHSTPLLSYEMLAALTGKSKRTLQGHITALRTTHTALRLQIAGGGDFVIVFDQRLWDSSRERKKLHRPVKEYKESIQKEVNPINSGFPVQTPGQTLTEEGSAAKYCAETETKPDDPPDHGLESDLAAELLTAGVYPGLLTEVGRSDCPPETLRALLAWSRSDSPQKPGGLFISRLRAGAAPPERFTQTPCPRCGQVGDHAAGCYMRYAEPADLQPAASEA